MGPASMPRRRWLSHQHTCAHAVPPSRTVTPFIIAKQSPSFSWSASSGGLPARLGPNLSLSRRGLGQPTPQRWPAPCHCPAGVIYLPHIPRDMNGGFLCPRACFVRSPAQITGEPRIPLPPAALPSGRLPSTGTGTSRYQTTLYYPVRITGPEPFLLGGRES